MFLETPDRQYTYGDLCKAVESCETKRPYVNITTVDPFEWIRTLFAAKINGSIAVLGNFTPNQSDIEKRPSIILSTSGTRFRKQVMHREESLFTNTKAGIRALSMDECGDRMASIVPFNHIFGLICGLICPLILDNVILCPHSPITFFTDIWDLHPTFIVTIPGVARHIPGDFKGTVLYGGASHIFEDMSAIQGRRYRALIGYGSTETLCVSVGPSTIPTSGRLLDHIEVRIIDEEVCVQGCNMIGYCEAPCLEGWYHTGDSGTMNGDTITVYGRMDDVDVLESGRKINYVELTEWIRMATNSEHCQIKRNGNVLEIHLTGGSELSEDQLAIVKEYISPLRLEMGDI